MKRLKFVLFGILSCNASVLRAAANGPMRIVSASLASDEILVDILSRSGGTGRIAALSSMAHNPRYSNILEQASHITGRFTEDPESLIELKPDLVILASFNRPEFRRVLERTKIPMISLTELRTLEDIDRNIELIGASVDKKAGDALASEFRAHIDSIKKQAVVAPRRKVLNFHDTDLLMGHHTLFNEIVELAGGENLAKTIGIEGWQTISREVLAGLKPDFIVAPQDERSAEKVREEVRATSGWNALAAVKEGRIIVIPERQLLATSHHIVEAIDVLRKSIHGGSVP